MTRRTSGRYALLLVLLLEACGGSDGGGGGGPDGGGGPMTITLISRSWTQAANSESYQCREIQATSDLLLTSFHPTLPPGQFRMWVVTSDAPTNSAPGDFDCAASALIASGNRLIYAAGMGTNDIQLPAGVGVRIKNGQYVTLIVQVVNVTGTALSGTSGVTAQTTSQITNEADMIFAGTTSISIPANGTGSATGGCSVPGNWTIFALLPMQNRLGVHHTVTLTHSGSSTLHDASYDFNQQVFDSKNVTVVNGDNLQTTCDYNNLSGATVVFGPESTDEVCLTGVYRFPAPSVAENPFACVSH
jgi:hypothetical protein